MLDISGRNGPWSGKGSTEAPTKGNREGEVGVCWVEGHIHGGRGKDEGVGSLRGRGISTKVLPLTMLMKTIFNKKRVVI